ncbi:hypothetical protein FJTKL_12948 [Diaporthe vaccinii]|uniref:Uncharacterized protein n=1 Tax=Diaporthe vaccinii TaxID=105482 RepID=A0ABR4FA70_9PEZI
MAFYVLSRERCSRIDRLHSLHNTLLALDLIASLVVAGSWYGVRVGLSTRHTQTHPVCLDPVRLHHRELSFAYIPLLPEMPCLNTPVLEKAKPVPLRKSPFAGSE